MRKRNIVRIAALLAALVLVAATAGGCGGMKRALEDMGDYNPEVRGVSILDGSTVKVSFRPRGCRVDVRGYALVPPFGGYGPRKFDLGIEVMSSNGSDDKEARFTFAFDYLRYVPAEMVPGIAYYFHVTVADSEGRSSSKYFRYLDGEVVFDPPNMDRAALDFPR